MRTTAIATQTADILLFTALAVFMSLITAVAYATALDNVF